MYIYIYIYYQLTGRIASKGIDGNKRATRVTLARVDSAVKKITSADHIRGDFFGTSDSLAIGFLAIGLSNGWDRHFAKLLRNLATRLC